MSPLRQRMLDALVLRGMAVRTQESYIDDASRRHPGIAISSSIPSTYARPLLRLALPLNTIWFKLPAHRAGEVIWIRE